MGYKIEVLDVPKMVQVEQWIAAQERKQFDVYFSRPRIPSSSPERSLATEVVSPPSKRSKVENDISNVPESRYEKMQKRLRTTLIKQAQTIRSLVFNENPKMINTKIEDDIVSETAEATKTPYDTLLNDPLHPDLDEMETSVGVDMSSFLQAPIVRQELELDHYNENKTSKCGRKTRIPARFSEPVKIEADELPTVTLPKVENKSEKREPLRELNNVSKHIPTTPRDQSDGLRIELGSQFTSFAQFEALFLAWKQQGNYPMRIVSSESLKDVDQALADELKYKKVVYHCYYYGAQSSKACGCEAKLRLCYNKQDKVLKIVGFVSEHKGHGDQQEEPKPNTQNTKHTVDKGKTAPQSEDSEIKLNMKTVDSNVEADPRIVFGGTFKSYDEFESVFEAWRTVGCHPLRIISSEALRDSNGVQDVVCRYRKITYQCYHYGSLHNRVPGANGKITALACGCEGMLRLSYIKNENVLRITGLETRHKGHARDREHFKSTMQKMLTLNRAKKRHTPSSLPQAEPETQVDSAPTEESVAVMEPTSIVQDKSSENRTAESKQEGYRFTSKSILPVVDSTVSSTEDNNRVATAVLVQTLLSQKILLAQLSSDPNVSSDPQKHLLLEMTKLQHLQLLVQLQQLNTQANS